MNATADLPVVTQLRVADLARIAALQDAVTEVLPVGFIRSKTESELLTYLDGTQGAAYGLVEGTALLAMSLLHIPDVKHPNGGLPFPLVPEEDWPLYACFLENTLVLPGARGRGYQRTLIDARLSYAASTRMKWICAGVHLQNSVSWANLLAKGMAIVGIRFDFGYPVIGLLSSLGTPTLTSDSSDQIRVIANDHTQHQAALQNGYIGVRRSDGLVIYERLRSQWGEADYPNSEHVDAPPVC